MHTQGHWKAEKPSFFDPNCCRHVVDSAGHLVARINFANPIQSENEAIANADLIAIAPEMLDALKKAEAVLAQLQDNPDKAKEIIVQGYFGHALIRSRAVLAKVPA